MNLEFQPALPGWMFTQQPTETEYFSPAGKLARLELPARTYAFQFLGSILVVYHNPRRQNTFGPGKVEIQKILLHYPNPAQPVKLSGARIPSPHAHNIRSRQVERIDVFLG